MRASAWAPLSLSRSTCALPPYRPASARGMVRQRATKSQDLTRTGRGALTDSELGWRSEEWSRMPR